MKTKNDYRNFAKKRWRASDEVDIANEVDIVPDGSGAYVKAWVWVDINDLDDTIKVDDTKLDDTNVDLS